MSPNPDFYLRTPDGVIRQPVSTELDDEVMEQGMVLLLKHDWLELRLDADITRWTVARRAPGGCPVTVLIEDSDGDLGVVNCE